MLITKNNYRIYLKFIIIPILCRILSGNEYVFQDRDISFEFNYLSTEIIVGSDSVGSFNGIINNISTDTIIIAVVRRENALPENWTSSICLGRICYNESTDSVSIELHPGDSTECEILVWTNAAGEGMVKLDIFDLNNLEEHVLIEIDVYTSSSVNVGDDSIFPSKLLLYQAFPNPFNAATKIDYFVPYNSLIKLIIYDLNGRYIKLLVNSNHFSGRHSAVWNGTDNIGKPVPSGMYIYCIQNDNFRQTKKMVLLK